MDFTNEAREFIVEPFIELLTQEFKDSLVSMDGNVGADSFFIHNILVEKGETKTRGDLSFYEMDVIREIVSVESGKDVFEVLSKDAARCDRLIHNYRDFSVPVNWIDEGGTWGNTTHTWVEGQTTYCWTAGQISIMDFTRPADLASDKHQVLMLFKCFRERVIG